jgi:hypothetical protein
MAPNIRRYVEATSSNGMPNHPGRRDPQGQQEFGAQRNIERPASAAKMRNLVISRHPRPYLNRVLFDGQILRSPTVIVSDITQTPVTRDRGTRPKKGHVRQDRHRRRAHRHRPQATDQLPVIACYLNELSDRQRHWADDMGGCLE